jgi:HEAT repeat protein
VPPGRLLALLVALALLIGAAAWYYKDRYPSRAAGGVAQPAEDEDAWLVGLMSQNPRESEAAAQRVKGLGARALPLVRDILQDPQADIALRKAALRAAAMIGHDAAPAIPDVAAHLYQADLTEEAAVALSFMGTDAFAPLRDALASGDAAVRREALRSVGKLTERAPLEPRAVLPLLIKGMRDPDPGVRAVGATYLGVIHGDAAQSVDALAKALSDPDVTVRRVAAVSLASFSGAEAKAAMPELRKATRDKDPDVAREAGATLIKLRSSTAEAPR